MGCSVREEEEMFFDTHECIDGVCSDSGCSEVSSGADRESVTEDSGLVFRRLEYDVWRKTPDSVHNRRQRFLQEMLFDEEEGDWKREARLVSNCPVGLERIMKNSGAVLRMEMQDSDVHRVECCAAERRLSCAPSSAESFGSVQEADENCCIRDLDRGKEFFAYEFGQNGTKCVLKEVGSERVLTMDEFERSLGISQSACRLMQKEAGMQGRKSNDAAKEMKKRRKSWWKSLRVALSIAKRRGGGTCRCDDSVAVAKDSIESRSLRGPQRRMKVEHHQKLFKEFTALFIGEEIHGHKGAIRTMKFCPEGKYLASAGEDGVVRIWCITQSMELNSDGIKEIDVFYKSQPALDPHFADAMKEKLGHGRKSMHSVPVIIPKKLFKISEQPLHEFHGHTSDVLDLSWSQTKYLLSSSIDKTVRLWQVGCDRCLKVFHHNNYVTCVHFNPLDDRFFISGSIDGKVRIWAISKCQVVEWADIRGIITAVCYRPDGKGIIVGSISGECRFYDASGNRLQLVDRVCLQHKKTHGKQITGFQFSPTNSQRMMVTSADSHVRIFDGVNVVFKYKGFRGCGSQKNASFTSNGRYIVSASEDSGVYVWNYDASDVSSSKRTKSISSCEHFPSGGITVAIPWSGTQSQQSTVCKDSLPASLQQPDLMRSCTWLPDSDRISGCLSDALSKNSMTWPEEKLSPWTNCRLGHPQKTATWGLVIVTAGWDGVIRTFHNYGLPIRL